MKGIEPQTIESIEILKSRKTPFMVVVNKIDLIKNWKSNPNSNFLDSYNLQTDEVKGSLENKLYQIIGDLSSQGFNSERYDRITNFRKTLAVVPTSAKTGEGISDLITVLVGLAQTYLKEELKVTSGPAKGVVLEVKEEPGLGITINSIIYDGILKVGDAIVLGGREGVIETNVRTILIPKPLDEIRDPKEKFIKVTEVSAAAGVKIAAPNLEFALAGSQLLVISKDVESNNIKKIIEDEINKLRIVTDKLGIVIKADTLGSLEALIHMLKNHDIPIRLADVGDVSKRDAVEAETVKKKNMLLGIILAFNVSILPDAQEELTKWDIKLFKSNIIYHLVEQYQEWVREIKFSKTQEELDSLIRPGKIKILKGYIFRRNKPAIIGVEILKGRIKSGYPLMNTQGKKIGSIQRIQDKGNDIHEVQTPKQVAISIDEGSVGRNIFEGDTLYVAIPKLHRDTLLNKFKTTLTNDELEIIKELIMIHE
jgi:translation initiation factor 5B